jgi:hypothetical protein
VVVIHGLLGSRLVDRRSGEVVWGGLHGLLGGGVADPLAMPLDPDAEPGLDADGFVRSVAGIDVYGGILDTLEQQGGYLRDSRQTPPYRRSVGAWHDEVTK